MKQRNLTYVMLVLVSANLALAKVSDFNSLINENTRSQKELHNSLKQNLEVAETEAKQKNIEQTQLEEKYVVENSQSTVNVPTSKSFLTFTKEKKYHRPSAAQQQKRLAEEMVESQ